MPLNEEKIAEINQAIEATVALKENEGEKNTNTEQMNVAGSDTDISSDIGDGVASKESTGTKKVEVASESDNARTEVEKGKEDISQSAAAVSDYALTQAVQSGFSIEDAREYGSDKLLLRAVDMVRRAAEKVAPLPEVKQEDDPLTGLPDFKPEDFETPEVATAFNTLKDIVKKQQEKLNSFESQQKHIYETNEQAGLAEVTRWLDVQIEKLGPDFQDALGKGGHNAISPESPQYAKRDAIARQVAAMVAGYRMTDQRMPSREDLFVTASKIVLEDEYRKISEKKISSELEKRSQQHISRVAGKSIKQLKNPLEEVAAMVDEAIRKKT